MTKTARHILNLSGGKDSTALALFMRDKVPDMEYLFCDSQKELPETYDYLNKLEAILGKRIIRLNDERGFDHWLDIYGGFLPSSQMRWCTRMLKLKPFEQYVGDDKIYSYVGIRADEDRTGYISTKLNIVPVFPFKDYGLALADIQRILEESGIGLPKYYEWRSRSGCYFCFFQRKIEWVGLLENHPQFFEKAKSYEKVNSETGERYTWCDHESLDELSKPDRIREIKENYQKHLESMRNKTCGQTLVEMFGEDNKACNICSL